MTPMLLGRILAFLVGMLIVLFTLYSAVRTFVLPRSANDNLTRFVFGQLRRLFLLRLRWTQDYDTRDRVMAFYAPIGLLLLVPTWMLLVLTGYTAMFWAVGVTPLYDAFILSGSSLFTLGFARSDPTPHILLNFTESTIGLILVALLMAYLPTMYGAFQQRERTVSLLEVRAGSPPSAVEMILRFHRLGMLHDMHSLWVSLEEWFAELQESHTSLAALVFFRSPRGNLSWVTASGAVLDAGALLLSAVDVPRDVQVNLVLRAGYLTLRSIADFFKLPYNESPHYPQDPISVSREEFEEALDRMAEAGIPLHADRDQIWRDFAGWRVNYDAVLVGLCVMTMAPPAPWTVPAKKA